MDYTTFVVYLVLYVYGFSLMIWALYFDKRPTKKSLMASKLGLAGLSLTLLYFFYVIWTFGLHS
jgi:hypothetical protein